MLVLKKMYTLSVPCLTQFVEDDSECDVSGLPDKLWISDSCICRIDGDSLLILNGLYQAFYGTGYANNAFQEGYYLNKKDYSNGIIQQLIKKKIVDPDTIGKTNPHIISYNQSILPYYATLEITQHCNAKCNHCYNGLERSCKDPSLQDIIHRIEILHELGIQYIEVTGGEPLMRMDLSEIIAYIKNRGMKFCLATNGYFVEENVELLKMAECVAISLDGDEAYHNGLRGINVYGKVVKAIAMMQKSKIRTVVSMTVTPDNLNYVEHVMNVTEKYGAELILAAVVPTGLSEEKPVLHENESNNIIFSGQRKIYGDSLQRPKVEVNKSTAFNGCDMGRKGFTVNIDGDILPCLFIREFSIGKLEGMTVDRYNSTIRKMCVERRKMAKKCDTCSENNCGGLCIFSRSHVVHRKKEYKRAVDFTNDMMKNIVEETLYE